ncbi:ribosome-binding protein 1 isoform X3 [Pieris brassicae]|uniref:ribosome-binding protein 1 isoform X3 n=1 Tax=Pieris brassicae TaxID=7116 RepID=UPI001E662418|nr:ribosome-binding protein 1 isoform X3 [Pieris brassicae]
MELQALLVFGGVGVVVIAIVLLMGLFSASGTSYEEAIAQQRKATSELLALANNKTKSKKTSKKANKKIAKKEKNKEYATAVTGSDHDSEAPAESGLEDEPTAKPHVDFKPPPVVVEFPNDTPPNIKIRKRGKDSKVKPILVNKEDPSCVSDLSSADSSAPVTNHFEEMQPKDEFELLHSSQVGDKTADIKQETVEKKEKPKQTKGIVKAPVKSGSGSSGEVVKEVSHELSNSSEVPKEQRKAKKPEKKAVEEVPSEEEAVPPLNTPQPSELTTDKLLKQAMVSAPAHSPPASKSKKKKAEPNVLSLIASDSGGVSVSELVRVVKEASLSRTEIQILTDALLNKQHDPLPEHSEWTEGPNDPMQKMKKQLADKEKALADEVDASQALHAKLKELRSLLNAERGRASSASRAAEQTAAASRVEMHTLQTRIQRLLDENHALAQEKLVLQAQLGEENEAQAQRVQMEMHIQRLSESEAALLQQLTVLQAEVSGRAVEAGQARCEVAAARDSVLMAQQHAADLAHQLQEANRLYSELENQRQCAVHAEQLARDELRQTQQRLTGLTELQSEIQKTSARAQTAESALDESRAAFENQKQQLTRELNSLREQLAARESELAEVKLMKAAPAHNGLSPAEDTEKLKQANELSKVESAVEALKAELSSARADNEKQQTQLTELRQQLEQYREKNNELRTKNWKVMEALQNAERSLQAKAQARGTSEASKVQEYGEVMEVLRSACPSAAPSPSTGSDWIRAFADNVKNHLRDAESKRVLADDSLAEKENEKKKVESELLKKLQEKENEKRKLESELQKKLLDKENEKKRLESELEARANRSPVDDSRVADLVEQNRQLQASVDKYQRVIHVTEGVLSQLQRNVSAEEARWASRLAEQQRELDELRQRTVLQEPVAFAYSCIEKSLSTIIAEMQNKIDELEAAVAKKNTSFADAERLAEEKLSSNLSKADVHNGPPQATLAEK